ncbi:hypothetical protein TNCV_2288391 [Trichonephila clavipes]|nr:hypothetical protein TNCV_2288391 [Trichonephila clavipes]
MIILIIYSRETSGSSRKNNVAVGCLVLVKENDLPPANGQWQESWRLFMELTVRSVAMTVSAISMILGPHATGAPTCVTYSPTNMAPIPKKDPEGTSIQGPLRASYASDFH